MQMTPIFVSAAVVYSLLICGVVAQNHQALAVRELGARSSQDTLPLTGPQASASNPTTVDAEKLENLKGNLKDLELEKEKVRQSKGKDRKNRLNALNSKINHNKRRIQGLEMGLRTTPIRLLHGNLRQASNHPSISERQEKIKRLEEEHKGAQDGKERSRLYNRLLAERAGLRQERIIGAIKGGEDPRKAEALFPTINERKTPEVRVKEIAAAEMEIEQEQDPAQLKKLKKKLKNLKYRKRKAEEKTQQSHEPHNRNEKAVESEVGKTSEGAHMAENSDSNGVQLPGAGLEADQELNFLDWDADLGVSDCSGNNFDNFIQSMSDEEFRKWFETMEEVQH